MTSLTSIDSATETAGPQLKRRRDLDPDGAFFAALGPPFGSRALDLSIGPLRMGLRGLTPGQEEKLAGRFRPFVRGLESDRTLDLAIALKPAGVEHFLAPPHGQFEMYRMERHVRGRQTLLWSYEFAAAVDTAAGAAVLALVAPDGPLFERGLENFLRALTAEFVLDKGGLLIHGSGVVRGGRAFIFYGPSGSGKTTVARLSPEDTILSDDLTLIVPGETGYRAAGIPFGMAHHSTPQTSGSFPIASINRLVQSLEVRRERLDGARALADLGGSLPFVMENAAPASRALEIARLVLQAVPSYRLHFRREPSFWPLVEAG